MKLSHLRAGADDAARSTARRAELAARGRRGPGALGGLLGAALGAVAGAVAAFLLDPARGRARRARLLDQGAATVRRGTRAAQDAVRQARAAVEGRVAAVRAERAPSTAPIDDVTLTDRVKSTLLREEEVPGATISINVERGTVVLRGEVPDDEVRTRLVERAEAIDGVWGVRDLLHLPGEEPVGAGAPR